MNQGTIFRRPDNPDYPYFVIAPVRTTGKPEYAGYHPFVRWRPALPGMSKINPIVVIGDEKYILMTHLIQTVYLHELNEEDIHSYRAELRDTLVNAVDFLVTGS